MDPYLSATSSCDSEHPSIRAMVNTFILPQDTPTRRALKKFAFVRDQIRFGSAEQYAPSTGPTEAQSAPNSTGPWDS